MVTVRDDTTSQHKSRRAFRIGRVRLAFITSAVSKALGFLVQFLAIPLAVKALGAERFGIYTMIVSALVWIDLGRLGIGPGLTRGIAVAWNQGDKQGEKELFSNAFFLLTAMALLVGGMLALILGIDGLSLKDLVGDSAPRYRNEILAGVAVVMGFLMAQIIFSAGEAARSAYQEEYINNIMNSLGNLLAMVLVIWVAYYWPTIQGFCVAIFGSIALSKGLNIVVLLGVSRRYLLPRWRNVRPDVAKHLLNLSFAFWIVQLATLMMHNFSLVQLGAIVGPETLAPFALLFRMLQLLSTVVLMVTMPLWPAITDALIRGDHNWIRYAYTRLLKIVLSFSMVVAVVLGLKGDDLIRLWVPDMVDFDVTLIKVLSVYFVIWMWNHSNTTVLFGLGRLWPVACTLLVEGSLVLILGSYLTPSLGNLGMALALCIAGVATSSWVLPLLIRRELHEKAGELET